MKKKSLFEEMSLPILPDFNTAKNEIIGEYSDYAGATEAAQTASSRVPLGFTTVVDDYQRFGQDVLKIFDAAITDNRQRKALRGLLSDAFDKRLRWLATLSGDEKRLLPGLQMYDHEGGQACNSSLL